MTKSRYLIATSTNLNGDTSLQSGKGHEINGVQQVFEIIGS